MIRNGEFDFHLGDGAPPPKALSVVVNGVRYEARVGPVFRGERRLLPRLVMRGDSVVDFYVAHLDRLPVRFDPARLPD